MVFVVKFVAVLIIVQAAHPDCQADLTRDFVLNPQAKNICGPIIPKY